MNIKEKIIIYPSFGIVIVTTIFVFINASAQLEIQTDKVFIKNDCDDEIQALNLTKSDLQYDLSGCTETVITIHNYDKLTLIEQTAISTELTTKGYSEKLKEVIINVN